MRFIYKLIDILGKDVDMNAHCVTWKGCVITITDKDAFMQIKLKQKPVITKKREALLQSRQTFNNEKELEDRESLVTKWNEKNIDNHDMYAARTTYNDNDIGVNSRIGTCSRELKNDNPKAMTRQRYPLDKTHISTNFETFVRQMNYYSFNRCKTGTTNTFINKNFDRKNLKLDKLLKHGPRNISHRLKGVDTMGIKKTSIEKPVSDGSGGSMTSYFMSINSEIAKSRRITEALTKERSVATVFDDDSEDNSVSSTSQAYSENDSLADDDALAAFDFELIDENNDL